MLARPTPMTLLERAPWPPPSTPTRTGAAACTTGGRAAVPVPCLRRSLIWAGAAGVLALWWADTTSVVGPAGWLTDAGRITGLLAGYACAVLLVADGPRPAPGPRRRHRPAGPLARHGRPLHRLAGPCPHAADRLGLLRHLPHHRVTRQTTTLVLHYPDLLKGTVGFVLFLATGVLSARAARRRMSYETWHYLHFATYLAVFLAFGHQLSNGADFVGDRPAQARLVRPLPRRAVLLAWYRFAVPLRRGAAPRSAGRRGASRRRRASCRSTSPVRHLDELGGAPGQFLRWRFLARGLWWTANPYSLSAPADPRVPADHGEGGRAGTAPPSPGWRRAPGCGPRARTARSPRTGALARRCCCSAGGVGITPLRALFETLPGAR